MYLTIKRLSINVPILVVILLIIDLALCLFFSIDILLGRPNQTITRLINLDGEANLVSWYSSTQLFCAFILSAYFSYHKMKERGKLNLIILLPIIFLLMSIDETAQIHENFGLISDVLLPSQTRTGTSFHKTGIWMFIIGIPFFALFLWFLKSMQRQFANQYHNLKILLIGMVMLLTGALGFELISNFIDSKFYQIEVLFEEGLEMTGVTVMIWALHEMTSGSFKLIKTS